MQFRMLLIIVLALLCSACAKPSQKNLAQRAALINVAMGQKYLQNGQMDLSKQKLVHALDLDSKLPEAHTAIAYLYEMVGETKDAEKHHKLAIRYGAGKASFYNNYGTFLYRQERLLEAETAYLAALQDKKYPKTAEIYENVAICALRQKDTVKARRYFKSAVKHNPKLELNYHE